MLGIFYFAAGKMQLTVPASPVKNQTSQARRLGWFVIYKNNFSAEYGRELAEAILNSPAYSGIESTLFFFARRNSSSAMQRVTASPAASGTHTMFTFPAPVTVRLSSHTGGRTKTT